MAKPTQSPYRTHQHMMLWSFSAPVVGVAKVRSFSFGMSCVWFVATFGVGNIKSWHALRVVRRFGA